MDLVVGKDYYFLTPDEYNTLNGIYSWISTLYHEAPNGYYYADMDEIDGTEYWEILLEYGYLNATLYSKSNKPGGVL